MLGKPEQPEEGPILPEGEKRRIEKIVESMQQPMQSLLEQLREKIDSGEYTHVIGDDASGRIPTLIFREILKELYTEKGLPAPETKFIAGTRHFKSERSGTSEENERQKASMVHDFINRRIAGEKTKRVLITTDTVESGRSLLPLVKALREKEITFDIATIAITAPKYESEKLLEAEVYQGDIISPIYGKHDLSGVHKDIYSLHARPIPDYTTSARFAREKAKQLADELVGWYKQQK